MIHCIACRKDIDELKAEYVRYRYGGYEALDYFCPTCERLIQGGDAVETGCEEFGKLVINKGAIEQTKLQLLFWVKHADRYRKYLKRSVGYGDYSSV